MSPQSYPPCWRPWPMHWYQRRYFGGFLSATREHYYHCHKWLKLQFPFPSQLNYSQRHVSVNYVYVVPAAVADHHVRSLSWWLAGQPLRSNQPRAGNLLTVSFPSNSSTVQISRHSILYSYCLSTYLQIYQDKLLQLRLISLRDVDIHKCILLLTRDLQSRPRN